MALGPCQLANLSRQALRCGASAGDGCNNSGQDGGKLFLDTGAIQRLHYSRTWSYDWAVWTGMAYASVHEEAGKFYPATVHIR